MIDRQTRFLSDGEGKKINYLRVSVTDKCNLKCSYCMPQGDENRKKTESLLSYDELIRLIRVLIPLGIDKIRVTGGEPLLREDLPYFLKEIKRTAPRAELCLTTNGTLLKNYIDDLHRAGIDRLNVSLDTLRHERFGIITGASERSHAISEIIGLVQQEVFPLKVNVLLLPGVNTDEIADFIELARKKPVHIRFIEKMPIGNRRESEYIPVSFVEKLLRNKFGNVTGFRKRGETALNFNIKGFKGTIGLIAPLSRPFCKDCNRLRITAEGKILNCLLGGATYDVKSALRNGFTDGDIVAMIQSSLSEKTTCPVSKALHSTILVDRCMTNIGG